MTIPGLNGNTKQVTLGAILVALLGSGGFSVWSAVDIASDIKADRALTQKMLGDISERVRTLETQQHSRMSRETGIVLDDVKRRLDRIERYLEPRDGREAP